MKNWLLEHGKNEDKEHAQLSHLLEMGGQDLTFCLFSKLSSAKSMMSGLLIQSLSCLLTFFQSVLHGLERINGMASTFESLFGFLEQEVRSNDVF